MTRRDVQRHLLARRQFRARGRVLLEHHAFRRIVCLHPGFPKADIGVFEAASDDVTGASHDVGHVVFMQPQNQRGRLAL